MKRRADYSDAVVLVTGAARGIGKATAQRFAAQGATVWIGDVDLGEAESTAAGIEGARAAALDVTDPASWRDVVGAALSEHDRIDVLVNNAGVMPLGPLCAASEEILDLILDVNVKGVLNGMRAVTPSMIERGGGRVINVASMAGMIPIPGMVAYNASKFAVLGASLAARREFADLGVAVSAVLPAAVRTELSSGARLGGGMPTVEPDDVAAAIVKTARTGAVRVSVPRWVAPGWSVVAATVPERIELVFRRLIDDRRVLTSLDADGRRAYDERIARQSAAHAGGAS